MCKPPRLDIDCAHLDFDKNAKWKNAQYLWFMQQNVMMGNMLKSKQQEYNEIALREFVFDNRHKSHVFNAMNYLYATKREGEREKITQRVICIHALALAHTHID